MDRHDATGLALAAGLLLAEHALVWPRRGDVPLLARYVMGTAALCAGQSAALALRGEPWLRPWVYAAAGGAAVGAAHAARWAEHRYGLLSGRQLRRFREAAGMWADV